MAVSQPLSQEQQELLEAAVASRPPYDLAKLAQKGAEYQRSKAETEPPEDPDEAELQLRLADERLAQTRKDLAAAKGVRNNAIRAAHKAGVDIPTLIDGMLYSKDLLRSIIAGR